MRAARIHEFGGPDVLQSDEIAIPSPTAGQILVRVHAAAINPVDGKIRTGKFKRYRAKLPATLGRDFSGTVVQSEDEESGWKEGDEVFGMLDYARGAYADYCIALPSEMVRRPPALDPLHAACIGVAGQTAWQALFRYGELKSGQRVLVHGAGGGVGHLAVQFATFHGAEVTATVSPEDAGFVSELGAVETIDYKEQTFEELVHDVDLVLDLVGGDTAHRSWQVLRQRGILVSTLGKFDPPASAPIGVRGREVIVECQRSQMEQIASLAVNGQLRIEIDKVFPLDHAEEAHEHLEHGHSRGKSVLKVSEDL